MFPLLVLLVPQASDGFVFDLGDEVQVDLGGREFGVASELLDRAHVHAPQHEVRAEGVPEDM